MKNITHLTVDLERFTKRLEENLIKAQEETAKRIREDAIDYLKNSGYKEYIPGALSKYVDSIKVSETKKEGNCIKTSIYTDLKTDPTQYDDNTYLLGRIIEHGTGIHARQEHIGKTPTFKKSGYNFWYIPFQGRFIVARGQRPVPHFRNSLEKNIRFYNENIKKAVKEAK